MIALLLKLGLTERIAKIVAYIGLPLLAILLAFAALNAYGNSRYDAGRADEVAAWQAAQDKLLQQAAEAADEAGQDHLSRAVDYAQTLQYEKEEIDAAIDSGASPFDVLFPSGLSRQAGDGPPESP